MEAAGVLFQCASICTQTHTHSCSPFEFLPSSSVVKGPTIPEPLSLIVSIFLPLQEFRYFSLTVFVFSLFSLERERETKTKNSRFLSPNFQRLCLQFVHSQHTRKVMTKATGLSSSFRYYRSPK
jgi:hypothetical protein